MHAQGQRYAGGDRALGEIVADHGPVLFHQSGGCCDGSSPMRYRKANS